MSALPPIADIRRCRWDVPKVPTADIGTDLDATPASDVGLVLSWCFNGQLYSGASHDRRCSGLPESRRHLVDLAVEQRAELRQVGITKGGEKG